MRRIILLSLSLVALGSCTSADTEALCESSCTGSSCLDPAGKDCQAACAENPSASWCTDIDSSTGDGDGDGDASGPGSGTDGGPEAGKGEPCSTEDPCDGPTELVCSAEGRCVQCEALKDCTTPGAPRCLDNECGKCANDDHCERFDNSQVCGPEGECVLCTADNEEACAGSGTPRCDKNTCVECVENGDCKDHPNKSVCDPEKHKCVACDEESEGDCDLVEGKNVCVAGVCEECSKDDRSACDGPGAKKNVCDGTTHECTGDATASAKRCEPCVSDVQCEADHLCMPTSFDGATLPGHFCLPVKNPAQACITGFRPFVDLVSDGSSVDGATQAVCSLAVTTCTAYLEFRDTECTQNQHTSCGDDTIGTDETPENDPDDDGYCVPVDDPPVYRCTIPCGSNDDCDSGFTCGNVPGIVTKVCLL